MTTQEETLTKAQYKEVQDLIRSESSEFRTNVQTEIEGIKKAHRFDVGEFKGFKEDIIKELGTISTSITLLNFKAGMWAALGASIPSFGILVWFVIEKLFG